MRTLICLERRALRERQQSSGTCSAVGPNKLGTPHFESHNLVAMSGHLPGDKVMEHSATAIALTIPPWCWTSLVIGKQIADPV